MISNTPYLRGKGSIHRERSSSALSTHSKRSNRSLSASSNRTFKMPKSKFIAGAESLSNSKIKVKKLKIISNISR